METEAQVLGDSDAFALFGPCHSFPPDSWTAEAKAQIDPYLDALRPVDFMCFGLAQFVSFCGEQPAVAPAEVARRLGLPLEDVVAAFARLEGAGLVSRQRDDWPE